MTNREFIEMALANTTLSANADFVAKGKDMISALDKRKASGSGKKTPSKETVINGMVKEIILETLAESEKPMSIAEIIATLPTEIDYKDEIVPQTYTSNRISSLLVGLRKENKVKRTYDKKTALFELGSEEE